MPIKLLFFQSEGAILFYMQGSTGTRAGVPPGQHGPVYDVIRKWDTNWYGIHIQGWDLCSRDTNQIKKTLQFFVC